MNSTFDQDKRRAESLSMVGRRFEEYRKLTREKLGKLPALFTRVTRLESSVAWAPTWPNRWTERDLPTRSRTCRQITTGNPAALACCQKCGMRHLGLTLKAGQAGHHFLCHRGVRNFWFPIVVRGCAVGIGFVQGMDGCAARAMVDRNRAQTLNRMLPRRRPAVAKSTSRSEFMQVARLLQIILLHAQTSTLADLNRKDLARPQPALLKGPSMEKWRPDELRCVSPSSVPMGPAARLEGHFGRIVHAVLDRIALEYTQPLTLRRCAAKLRLNLSYLSHVFSCAVGMPFKKYLTELRIEKAKKLLSDPARSISDTGYAVGYASENRFRIAFKKATGFCPRTWRETVRAVRLVFLALLVEESEFFGAAQSLLG